MIQKGTIKDVLIAVPEATGGFNDPIVVRWPEIKMEKNEDLAECITQGYLDDWPDDPGVYGCDVEVWYDEEEEDAEANFFGSHSLRIRNVRKIM